jgi:hypothetical protein
VYGNLILPKDCKLVFLFFFQFAQLIVPYPFRYMESNKLAMASEYVEELYEEQAKIRTHSILFICYSRYGRIGVHDSAECRLR